MWVTHTMQVFLHGVLKPCTRIPVPIAWANRTHLTIEAVNLSVGTRQRWIRLEKNQRYKATPHKSALQGDSTQILCVGIKYISAIELYFYTLYIISFPFAVLLCIPVRCFFGCAFCFPIYWGRYPRTVSNPRRVRVPAPI